MCIIYSSGYTSGCKNAKLLWLVGWGEGGGGTVLYAVASQDSAGSHPLFGSDAIFVVASLHLISVAEQEDLTRPQTNCWLCRVSIG